MKIAVICSHSHTLYWYRLELLQEFIKNGHEVYGFADEPEELWAELFAEKGITYKQISISRNSMNPFTDIRTYFSIRYALKELKKGNPEPYVSINDYIDDKIIDEQYPIEEDDEDYYS